jgi:hypothetical protein
LVDYQIRYDYYVNVLCENQDDKELKCNGKCALMQDLKNVEQPNSQEEPSIPSFIQIDYFVNQLDVDVERQEFDEKNINVFHYSNFYKHALVAELDHPPQSV